MICFDPAPETETHACGRLPRRWTLSRFAPVMGVARKCNVTAYSTKVITCRVALGERVRGANARHVERGGR